MVVTQDKILYNITYVDGEHSVTRSGVEYDLPLHLGHQVHLDGENLDVRTDGLYKIVEENVGDNPLAFRAEYVRD
jgi:hypothetical protein